MTTLTFPLGQRVPQPDFQALRSSLKGDIHLKGDQKSVDSPNSSVQVADSNRIFARRFADQSKIFNGAIRTKAIALAIPEDASDVSK